jgi:hypothetical protein
LALNHLALIVVDKAHRRMVDGQPSEHDALTVDGTGQTSATQKRTAEGMSPPEVMLGSREIANALNE